MKRTAALLFLLALVPAAARADDSPWHLALQAGGITKDDGAGPMGTMTASYSPWRFGAFWGEFGVLNPKGGFGISASNVILNTNQSFNSQYLEASAGFMLGGIGKTPVYFRGGLGAYRYDSDPYERRWLVGPSLAFGALIGPSRFHARPVLEARLHVVGTTNPYAEQGGNLLGSLSGGVWFH